MTRDEIVIAITELSTVRPDSIVKLSSRMREVVTIADQYPDHADGATLAEALSDAMERFADHALSLF